MPKVDAHNNLGKVLGLWGLQRKSEWGLYTQCLNLCNLEPNKQSV